MPETQTDPTMPATESEGIALHVHVDLKGASLAPALAAKLVAPLSERDDALLRDRFSYHPPRDAEQAQTYVVLRAQAHAFADTVLRLVPDGRERALALTKIEEAVMWANSGVARGG